MFLRNKKKFSENQTAAKLADIQGLQYFLQGKEEVFYTKRKEQCHLLPRSESMEGLLCD